MKLHALQDSSCLLINVRQKLVGETSDPDHPQEIQLGEKICWHIVILRDTRFLDEYWNSLAGESSKSEFNVIGSALGSWLEEKAYCPIQIYYSG